MELSRRSFLGGGLVLSASLILPPIPRLVPIIYGDGINCDSAGLQALFDNKPFHSLIDGINILSKGEISISNCSFVLTKGLLVPASSKIFISSCHFECKIDDPRFSIFTQINS